MPSMSPGHDDVAEHHVDAILLQFVERLGGVRHPSNGIAQLLEQDGAGGRDIGIILDQKHGPRALGGLAFDAAKDGFTGTRQDDGNRRSGSQFALHAHRAARLMGKAVDLGQTEPGPLADGLGGEEGIEHF